ncbi:MAG: hypothetical protein KAQ67_07965, partial [Gammaproteobacteria bacterium]|nr:hypothetical protein [Gammaproteobacteria bacterium]
SLSLVDSVAGKEADILYLKRAKPHKTNTTEHSTATSQVLNPDNINTIATPCMSKPSIKSTTIH